MIRPGPALFLSAVALMAWSSFPEARAEEDAPPQVKPIVPAWAPVDKESPIKLKPGEYTIEALLSEILIQSGNHVPFANDRAPAGVRRKVVRVAKAETGFWEMLDLICDAGGLIYAEGSHNDDSAKALFPGKRPACPAVKSGPALLRIHGVSFRRNLLGEGQSSSEVQLDVELQVEPRLVDKGGYSSFSFASAEKDTLSCKLATDAGQELPYIGLQVLRSTEEDGADWSRWRHLHLVRFAAPPAGTKSLSGRLAMAIKVGSEPRLIRLDLAAGETGGEADRVTLRVDDFVCGAESAGAEAVSLRRTGRAMPVWEWPWTSLRDAEGRLLRTSLGGGSYGGSDSATRCTLQTAWQAPQGPAARIEAAYYLKQTSIKLEFGFENIPWSLEPGTAPPGVQAPKVAWEEPLRIPPIDKKPGKPPKKPPVPKPVPAQPEVF